MGKRFVLVSNDRHDELKSLMAWNFQAGTRLYVS